MIAASEGELERAARLLGASVALIGGIGYAFEPADLALYASTLKTMQARLPAPNFTSAWDAGQARTLDEAVDYALRQDG